MGCTISKHDNLSSLHLDDSVSVAVRKCSKAEHSGDCYVPRSAHPLEIPKQRVEIVECDASVETHDLENESDGTSADITQ
jgi:transcription elongation factor Elf1